MIEVASEEDALAQAIASLERNTPQPSRYLFRTQEDLLDTLTSNRFAILKALTGAGPIGVRELSRRVGRDVSAVHADAQRLSGIGLIDKTDGGKLHFPYDALDIRLGWRAAA
ncbi:MAG: transcriptional regulator [Halochromatium sp.]|uniref:HVO_A0114 family putative DNA-binding protein n=1 Tax=Halochromatium sp. TaxID=2049430 RepID=UPI00397A7955